MVENVFFIFNFLFIFLFNFIICFLINQKKRKLYSYSREKSETINRKVTVEIVLFWCVGFSMYLHNSESTLCRNWVLGTFTVHSRLGISWDLENLSYQSELSINKLFFTLLIFTLSFVSLYFLKKKKNTIFRLKSFLF